MRAQPTAGRTIGRRSSASTTSSWGHSRSSLPRSLPIERRALKPQLATRSNSWPRWELQNGVTGGRLATDEMIRTSSGSGSSQWHTNTVPTNSEIDSTISSRRTRRSKTSTTCLAPNAVSTADLSIDDHDALQKRWEELSEWRTVRRDIELLRRAVERAQRPQMNQ